MNVIQILGFIAIVLRIWRSADASYRNNYTEAIYHTLWIMLYHWWFFK